MRDDLTEDVTELEDADWRPAWYRLACEAAPPILIAIALTTAGMVWDGLKKQGDLKDEVTKNSIVIQDLCSKFAVLTAKLQELQDKVQLLELKQVRTEARLDFR
jgi:hypothetical protein